MNQNLHAPSFDIVISAASAASKLDRQALMHLRDQEHTAWRDIAMTYLYSWRYTYAEIGLFFSMNPASVHGAVKRTKRKMDADPEGGASFRMKMVEGEVAGWSASLSHGDESATPQAR